MQKDSLMSVENVDKGKAGGTAALPRDLPVSAEIRCGGPTERSLNIPPFIVMDILERAHELERNGRSIIHLQIGEPDFPTPECICEAAVEAIRKGRTHYTHSLGIVELRQAICTHYLEKYGVRIDPDQVMVTSGTSPALFMLFSTLLETGDEIILSDPHYPCYPNFARFLGAVPVTVKGKEEEGFQLNPE